MFLRYSFLFFTQPIWLRTHLERKTRRGRIIVSPAECQSRATRAASEDMQRLRQTFPRNSFRHGLRFFSRPYRVKSNSLPTVRQA